jgi:hypothetical protein
MLLFQTNGQDGYVKYQTFDEYKMEGIGNEKIKRPYVLVKKESDTVFVIKSNDRKKTIKYVNRGDYWHTKRVIKETASKHVFHFSGKVCPCSLIKEFCEKFIYNDTIVEYNYYYDLGIKDSLNRHFKNIYMHTKKDCIVLGIDITNYNAPFSQIKDIATNYKDMLPLGWLYVYEKQINGNVLSIYEIDGKGKKFIKSKKMNSLGEFGNEGILAWWY